MELQVSVRGITDRLVQLADDEYRHAANATGVGLIVSQSTEIVVRAIGLGRCFTPERLVGSGGMPSSHSATVCGLTTASALCYGVESFQFAISFVLAAVVMYDAIGVRQETGKQAKLLNLIMEQDWFNLNNQEIQKRLKEFVGHTPLQVAAGAALGIILAFVVHQSYL